MKYLINQINDIINPKYLKKEREKNLKWVKDKMRHIIQLIHLKEGWAWDFEHEYIIKLSKKDFVLHQLNLILKSDRRLALFRQTQTLTA